MHTRPDIHKAPDDGSFNKSLTITETFFFSRQCDSLLNFYSRKGDVLVKKIINDRILNRNTHKHQLLNISKPFTVSSDQFWKIKK